jgi:hypothetical protein
LETLYPEGEAWHGCTLSCTPVPHRQTAQLPDRCEQNPMGPPMSPQTAQECGVFHESDPPFQHLVDAHVVIML